MSKTIIVEDDLEQAIKRFKRISNETRRDFKKHEFYLRPGMRRALKAKEAFKKRKKFR